MHERDANDREWSNPANWTGPRWMSIYFSKRDSRAWVPKRIAALGWTLNLGQPRGAACFLAIMTAVVLIPALVIPATCR